MLASLTHMIPTLQSFVSFRDGKGLSTFIKVHILICETCHTPASKVSQLLVSNSVELLVNGSMVECIINLQMSVTQFQTALQKIFRYLMFLATCRIATVLWLTSINGSFVSTKDTAKVWKLYCKKYRISLMSCGLFFLYFFYNISRKLWLRWKSVIKRKKKWLECSLLSNERTDQFLRFNVSYGF